MKRILPTLFLLAISLVHAQNVTIPDAKFKAYLVGNTDINTNSDTEISKVEAEGFAGYMDCSGKSIKDLTGIESFINLDGLNINYDDVTSLDLSANTKLTTLSANGNYLESLNVEKLTALVNLECRTNKITSLDLSNNTKLETLRVGQNKLTVLDVSKNLVLSHIGCEYNSIVNIDISLNVKLTSIDCQNNKLKSLNLDNGKTLYFNLMKSKGNPDLSCIQVDNLSSVRPETWVYDATSSFSTNCGYALGVKDVVLDASIKIYPNPASHIVSISSPNEIESVKIYSVNGKLVKTIKNPAQIDVSSWSKGMYFFVMQIGTQSLVKEILVN